MKIDKQHLLGSIEHYHNLLWNEIGQYIQLHNFKVNLQNAYYFQLNEVDDSVEKIILKELYIEDDKIMLKYIVGEGYEPIEFEEYEDELWKFSFNDFVQIINAIKDEIS